MHMGYENMGQVMPAGFDKYKMFDSKEFNDIALGLFKMAVDSYIFGEEKDRSQSAAFIKDGLVENMKHILEKTSSRDAEYYNELL